MAQAKPIDAARGTGPTKAPPVPNSTAAAPPGTPHAAHFDGLPMVGTFFFDGTPVGGNATYCTGSVVRSKGKSLVLTAGHCANGLNAATHRVFVPQYQFLKIPANQPWGLFAVSEVYKDPRYPDTGQTRAAVSDLDFAFVTVAPNGKGAVEDVVGALTFTTSTSYDHNVTVVGYPAHASDNSQHKAIRCDVPTRRLYGFRQMQMKCGGYYGGVSGGPWIRGYNASARTGEVIGNVGGMGGGGDVDWISYAPLYGKDAQDLYNDANNGIGPKNVHRGTYQPPTDGPALPGSGETWKHAKQISAGDFSGTGHSDLLVIWTDGEVTLYPGDGNGGFRPERQLLVLQWRFAIWPGRRVRSECRGGVVGPAGTQQKTPPTRPSGHCSKLGAGSAQV